MIKLLRIDERLIHGQVVVGWSKMLNVSAIVVGSDEAARDSMRTMSLKMATPPGVKVAIKTIDEAIALMNDPRAEKMQILTLVDNPKDAYRIVSAVKGIPAINVGNFGRMNMAQENRKTYSAGFFANEAEVEWFQKLIDTKIPCSVQMTADQAKEDLQTLLNK